MIFPSTKKSLKCLDVKSTVSIQRKFVMNLLQMYIKVHVFK